MGLTWFGIVMEKGSEQDLIKGLRSDLATLKQECDKARGALANVTHELHSIYA